MPTNPNSPPGKPSRHPGGYGEHCRSVKACLLHINQLESFKEWLQENKIPYRPGKGEWQVLQVKTPKYGWQVIYSRKEMREHYSLNSRLVGTVEKFLRSQP